MRPDPQVWEQRGRKGYWYRIGKPTMNPRFIKVCEGCGQEALMQHKQRFCSLSCARKVSKPGYTAAHKRVEAANGKAIEHTCVGCGEQAAEWSYGGLDPDELADEKTGRNYSANPE